MLPEYPLEFIRRCIAQRKIRWTLHVNIRMRGRYISREFVMQSASRFEIIEEYPDDKYLPSYLLYADLNGVIFHVLVAVDVDRDNIRIVTVYYPDPEEWESDLKTRRKV